MSVDNGPALGGLLTRARSRRCLPGLPWASASYDGHVAAPVKSIEELQERVDMYARPRSADDVSITSDGRRLDTKEKVLEFLEELALERAADMPEG